MRRSHGSLGILVASAAVLAVLQHAHGQTVESLSEPVRNAITAEYLTEEEAADLRTFHGVWTEKDLTTPARRAMAALMVGAWDDPVFENDDVPAIDRAEAMMRRGDMADALQALQGEESIRARRVRAEALAALGRMGDADAAIQPIVETLERRAAASAEELVELVRALRLRATLRGGAAEDYHLMMGILAQARDQVDRLYWPAKLVEAQLLYEKDNRGEAVGALEEMMAMNPSCADAIRLRAELSVDGFQFDVVEQAAGYLDSQQARLPGGSDEEGSSALANLARSRAWMRQNDPDKALEALAPTLDRFPRQREALALQCAAQSLRFNESETERFLAAFDELSPESHLALYYVGRALSEARQYDEAASYLNRAIERLPNGADAWVELGLLYMQSGEDFKARDALARAVELDPFHVRADNSFFLITELLTFESVESEHFIVRYKPGVDRVMAEEMLPVLEEIHATVAGEIGHTPEVKTVIELLPDHRWFAVRITGMPAIHTIAAATGPVIAMEAPKIGPNHSGEYDWARVIQHEYTHTVTLSRTRNRIPHWFTEAAAVHLERAPRDYNTCRMLADAMRNDALFDMRQINIAFVRPEKPQDRSQAYAQGHWMYEFIIDRWGADAPLELMDLYSEGLREDEAMRSVLGISQEEFHAEFVEWARPQVVSWGLLPDPSMEEILLAETFSDEDGRADAIDALRGFAENATGAMAGFGRIRPVEIEFVELSTERIDALLEEYGDHPDLLYERVERALGASGGEVTDEIADLMERYTVARPVDDEPHRLLARHWLENSDRDSIANAVEHLRYLDLREQKSSAYAAELARRLFSMGDRDEAREFAERATQIAPFDPGLRELAATLALQARDFESAERHIEALVEIEPDRPRHRDRLEAIRKMLEGAT